MKASPRHRRAVAAAARGHPARCARSPNIRYRGVYLHGRIKKVRQGGTVSRVKADPREVIETEVP